jgi:branched-chain amino acid transport system permease protein
MVRGRVYKALGLVALYGFLAVLPFQLKYHLQDFMIFLLINVLVVVSYRLMTLTGEWSLIHVVLMGVGGYSSALLTKHAGLSFWLSMPLAATVCTIMAFLLSFPLFRMKGFYFLIGSFAAGEAVRLSWVFFKVPFGGAKGLKLIPSPSLSFPGFETVEIWEPIPYYFMTLAIVTVCLWVLYRLEHSRIGLTLHSVHWRDVLAESVGINIRRYKTLAFGIASFFVGIAGTLLTHYLGSLNPNQFGVGIMVYVLIWVIVGGTKTFYGPIIGVTVLSVLNEWFRAADIWRPLVYGVILIASIMFLPEGLESLPSKIRDSFRRVAGGKEKETEAGLAK